MELFLVVVLIVTIWFSLYIGLKNLHKTKPAIQSTQPTTAVYSLQTDTNANNVHTSRLYANNLQPNTILEPDKNSDITNVVVPVVLAAPILTVVKTAAIPVISLAVALFAIVAYTKQFSPTNGPSFVPTNVPTNGPSFVPTNVPTNGPSFVPTNVPTNAPTNVPTNGPSFVPTTVPTNGPSFVPTDTPTTNAPTTNAPTTNASTNAPTTNAPTTNASTNAPSPSFVPPNVPTTAGPTTPTKDAPSQSKEMRDLNLVDYAFFSAVTGVATLIFPPLGLITGSILYVAAVTDDPLLRIF